MMRPPGSTLTDTLCPYKPLFLSVDVLPESGMPWVRDHRAGTGQLARVPRRLVMLRVEAHRVEEPEAQHRAQHQRQGLVEHAMTICPGPQHAVNDDLEPGFTDMDRPYAEITLANQIRRA